MCESITITNGTLEFSQNSTNNRYLQGTSSIIRCNDGTVPNITLFSATCNDQGQWFPWVTYIPACKVPCPAFNLSQHLTASNSDTTRTVGTKVTFSCDPGFSLNGSEFVTCMQSGAWSDKTPSCTCKLVVIVTLCSFQDSVIG